MKSASAPQPPLRSAPHAASPFWPCLEPVTASVTARLLQEWCTKVLTPLDFCLYQSGLVETFCAAWHALHAAGRWLGQAVSVGGQPSSLGLGGGGGGGRRGRGTEEGER